MQLRVACLPCGDEPLTDEKRALLATLQVFHEEHGFGRGIAAPQIGVPRRFIAVSMGNEPRLLVDPVISWRSESTFTLFDECKSMPFLLCKVRRHDTLTVCFRCV